MGPITHSPALPTRERRRVKAEANLAVFPRRRARNREWKRTGQTSPPFHRTGERPHVVLTAACPEFTADCINSHFSSASRDMGKGVLVRPSVPRRGEEGGGPFSENVCFRPVGRRRQSKKFSLPIRASLSLSVDVCLARVWGLLRRKIKVTCIARRPSPPRAQGVG